MSATNLIAQSTRTFSCEETEFSKSPPLLSIFHLYSSLVVGSRTEVDDRVAQSVVSPLGFDGSSRLFDFNPFVIYFFNRFFILKRKYIERFPLTMEIEGIVESLQASYQH